MSAYMSCARCGGCGDAECWGCASPRWCNATANGGGCDACMKPVERPAYRFRPAAVVPCIKNRHHQGECRPGNQRV